MLNASIGMTEILSMDFQENANSYATAFHALKAAIFATSLPGRMNVKKKNL